MSDRAENHPESPRLIALRRAAREAWALRTSAALAVEIHQQEERTMQADITALTNEVLAASSKLTTALVAASRIAPPPRDLRPVLVQLADVEREIEEHGKTWWGKLRAPGNTYSCPEEQAAWQTLCRRRESLVADVVRYALAMTTPLEPANEQSGWHTGTSARTP